MSAGKSQDLEYLLSIELLTVPEVAQWAKVSTKTIYRWIDSGEIPAIRFGKRTFRIPARVVIEQLKKSGYDHLLAVQVDK